MNPAPGSQLPAPSSIDIDAANLTSKRNVRWKDEDFKIICNEQKDHPSWWSHMDEYITRDLWWNIQEGEVVLDIGADWGSYTLPALASGAALVIAWSPPFKSAAPIEAHGIHLSAWENDFQNRLILETSGLWSEKGWLASMDGMRHPAFYRKRETALTVIKDQPGYCSVFPVTTLDDYLINRLDHLTNGPSWEVDWIKIDTEGCELEVLKGAVEVITDCHPNILVENHPHILPDAERAVEEFLLSLNHGYQKVGTRPHYMVSHSLYTADR